MLEKTEREREGTVKRADGRKGSKQAGGDRKQGENSGLIRE